MKIIDIAAGTRPNFIKIASIISNLKLQKEYNRTFKIRVIHTGQHKDYEMSGSFFAQLKIDKPFKKFKLPRKGQVIKFSEIIKKYDEFINKCKKPHLVIIVGDVDSTAAIAVSAKKNKLPIAHIEAGLRCGEENMPEEINRKLTDTISNICYTTSRQASQNLLNENISKKKITFIGNTMIDTLKLFENNIKSPTIFNSHQLNKNEYILLTIHREDNTINSFKLNKLVSIISNFFSDTKIIFSVHPRIKNKIDKKKFKNIIFSKPFSYLEFIYLIKNSRLVITDSGGISEETTILNIPCITLRDVTERSETVTSGTNHLVGKNLNNLKTILKKLIKSNKKSNRRRVIEKWDGNAGLRLCKDLRKRGYLN